MAAVTYMLGVLFATQLWKAAIRHRGSRKHHSRRLSEGGGGRAVGALWDGRGQLSSEREDESSIIPGLEALHPAPDVDGIKGHGIKEYRNESKKVMEANYGSPLREPTNILVVVRTGDGGGASSASPAGLILPDSRPSGDER